MAWAGGVWVQNCMEFQMPPMFWGQVLWSSSFTGGAWSQACWALVLLGLPSKPFLTSHFRSQQAQVQMTVTKGHSEEAIN